jgi:hypothetical protein
MRPHINAGARRKLRGTKMVEKNERPDHLPALVRQYPAHDKATQVTFSRAYHL